MASKFARDKGYEEDRFELPVSENFKCAICLNVLNNPKSCRNNQHYFCFGCIGQHLENSHTCPECMELNHDIIIMGGMDEDNKPTNSVEKFCCKEGKWVDVAPMIMPRESASSVVFDNQVIVSGGYSPTHPKVTDSIEILNLDQCPLKWKMSAGKLPVPLSRHQSFVYKGKLILIYMHSKNEINEQGRHVLKHCYQICEVLLTPPYSARELYSLHQLSSEYRAELVKDKLFIFGIKSKTDVKFYDLDKNECRKMPDLPEAFSVNAMTTVQRKNDVILLGGNQLQHSEVPNSHPTNVIKYNTITGETEILAPMKHTRDVCSAVVVDDVIIAMGGRDNSNSVECYNFHTDTWQALPVMRETRYLATAVVSPISLGPV